MTFLDKTFCASPGCVNECGHKMTELEKYRLESLVDSVVSYSYLCGYPKFDVEITLPKEE